MFSAAVANSKGWHSAQLVPRNTGVIDHNPVGFKEWRNIVLDIYTQV
jgi:hypothetical protein